MARDLLENKKFIVASGIILIAALIFAGIAGTKKENIDTKPEGTDTDYSHQARIVDGEDVLKSMKSVDAYNSLSEDIYTFAETAYPEYKNSPNKVVGFRVGSKPKEKDNVITFKGNYGSVSNSINITVTLLKNSRIKTSITDAKTQLNIDTKLPSNSKENQFLGGLPYETSTYRITYNTSTQSFTITALVNDPSIRQVATDYIVANSGLAKTSVKTLFIPFLN